MSLFSPRSREQKLVDQVYPFFGEIAKELGSDHKALELCQKLIAANGRALSSTCVLPLLDLWSRDCPEEFDITEAELNWALKSLEAHIAKQLYQLETGGTLNPVPRRAPVLRVIKGGKSAGALKQL